MKKMIIVEEEILEDLSIDCVIFGFDGKLKVLLVKHNKGPVIGQWGLPGGFVTKKESLDEAANRLLFRLTGIKDLFLEQTKAFGAVNRFPTKRVVTIGYQSLVRIDNFHLRAGFTASEVKWFPVEETPELIYDHPEILSYTLNLLRKKVRQEPLGFNMLPASFTLYQLQSLYEAVLRITLDKPNFRRKINNMKLLVDTGKKETDASYRAAKLYRFDQVVYDRLKERKFVLDFA